MNKNQIFYATRFLKAFNKYLIISWAVFIVGFSIYSFGAVDLFKKGPMQAFADDEEIPQPTVSDESDIGEESVDLPASESIEPVAPASKPESQESVELPLPEPMVNSSNPDVSVVKESSSQPEHQAPNEGETVELPPSQPLVDSSIPGVSVITEEAPSPQPTPTPYQAPTRVIEREVIREVVRDKDKDGKDKKDKNSERRDQDNQVRTVAVATSFPTPTPTPLFVYASPSPTPLFVRPTPTPLPTTTVSVRGKTYTDVLRVIEPGTEMTTCPSNATTIITTRNTICDQPEVVQVARGEVLSVVATPSPTPLFVQSPSPRVSPLPTVTPTTIVVQAQPSVITSNNIIAIPVGMSQSVSCPTGTTRVQENNTQIVCQINATQTQAQVQSQSQVTSKQVLLIGTATPSATPLPQVVNIYKTDATELPKTGLPAVALGFGSLAPFGLGLRKWSTRKGPRTSANSIWTERQLNS